MKKLILTVAFLLMVPLGYAHERSYSDRVDIIEILDSYSERTGINFKKHFSIKARVNMIGLDMDELTQTNFCLLYTSPSPRDQRGSRMPSSA